MISSTLHTLLTTLTSPQLAEVHPVVISQDATYPAVRYARITSERDVNRDEVENWVRTPYQIDSYAKTYAEATDLAETVKSAINGYREGVIQLIRLDFETDGHENDTDLYRVLQQYTIFHTEP